MLIWFHQLNTDVGGPAPENKKESKTKTASAPKKRNSIEIVPSTRRITNAEILQRLHKTSTWNEVLNDEILGPRCVTNYMNIRNIYAGLNKYRQKSLAYQS